MSKEKMGCLRISVWSHYGGRLGLDAHLVASSGTYRLMWNRQMVPDSPSVTLTDKDDPRAFIAHFEAVAGELGIRLCVDSDLRDALDTGGDVVKEYAKRHASRIIAELEYGNAKTPTGQEEK